jgi:pyruvate/2-oxoglutarate/acetoin dehydrogenase E1 component
MMGEDILDPYGGAFKVMKGLSTKFPDRVRTTPVSEPSIIGIAGGLALAGYRPVVEIMFGDFLGLGFDQLINEIAKYGPMYAGKASCPVVVRTPSGGGRAYGPTHSQSLEKHFVGIPGLRVSAASPYHAPRDQFSDFLAGDVPVLFIEHKLLYPVTLRTPQGGRIGDNVASSEGSEGASPTISIAAVPREDCTATIVAYGYPAALVDKILTKLAVEEEIFVELLVPGDLCPVDWAPIEASVARTGALLTVEEGMVGWSWGTGIADEVSRRLFGKLKKPVEVLASGPGTIPSAKPLERAMLVGEEKIEAALRRIAG